MVKFIYKFNKSVSPILETGWLSEEQAEKFKQNPKIIILKELKDESSVDKLFHGDR